MSTRIPLAQEEVDEITNLQRELAKLTILMGKTSLAIYETDNELVKLKARKDSIISEFETLKQSEDETSKKLQVKYGNGIVLVAEGVFVKDDEPVTKE
jgi:hypothetical protein